MKRNIIIYIFTIIMITTFSNVAEGNCNNMEYYLGELFRLQDMNEAANNCYESTEEAIAYIRRAQLALQNEDSQLAINILYDGLEEGFVEPNLYFWLARSYFVKGDSLKAEEYVLKYQNKYGKTAASFILLGDIYSNHNQEEKAYNYYSQAVDIEPNNEIARYRKWNLDSNLDNLQERIAIWLKDNPGDIRARNNYSEIKKKVGEHELGNLHSRLAEFDSSSVREVTQIFLEEGNLEKAESTIINYLRDNPEDTDIVYLLGSIYLSQNKIDKVESILETYPDFAGSRLLEARIKRIEGRNNQAVSIYWDYVKETPQNPDGYVGVAYLYLDSKRYELAIRDFKSAIYLEPQYLDAYTGICRAYLEKGDFGSVFYWSNLGLKYFPESFELIFLRAQAFHKLENYNEVIRLLSNNIPEDNDIKALSYLASSYLNKKDYNKAILTLEKIKKEISLDNYSLQININLALYYSYDKLSLERHSKLAKERLIIMGAEELLEKELSVEEIHSRLI